MILFLYIGVILLAFAALVAVSDFILYQQDRSLNARFRENQRIHRNMGR